MRRGAEAGCGGGGCEDWLYLQGARATASGALSGAGAAACCVASMRPTITPTKEQSPSWLFRACVDPCLVGIGNVYKTPRMAEMGLSRALGSPNGAMWSAQTL